MSGTAGFQKQPSSGTIYFVGIDKCPKCEQNHAGLSVILDYAGYYAICPVSGRRLSVFRDGDNFFIMEPKIGVASGFIKGAESRIAYDPDIMAVFVNDKKFTPDDTLRKISNIIVEWQNADSISVEEIRVFMKRIERIINPPKCEFGEEDPGKMTPCDNIAEYVIDAVTLCSKHMHMYIDDGRLHSVIKLED